MAIDDLSELANAAHTGHAPRHQPRFRSESPGYLLIVVSASLTLAVSLLSAVWGVVLVVYAWTSAQYTADPLMRAAAMRGSEDQGVAMIGAGVGGVMVAAVALAVRDIARNSWRR